MIRRWVSLVIPMILVAGSGRAANLDLTPLQRDLQFNFGNPGARSLGMGGAFLGRADDASAAEANPAGLTIITRPEITVEARRTRFSSSIPTSGTFTAPGYTNFSNTTSPRLSFVSGAYPMANFVLDAYYHVPLDFEQHATVTQLAPVDSTIARQPGAFSIKYKMETFGVAGAWKTGGLSVGASARYQRLSPASRGDLADTMVQGMDYPSKSLVIEGRDHTTTFGAGLKWANPTDTVSVGATYKSSGKYNFEECITGFGQGCSSPASTIFPSRLSTPDVLGVGVSIRPVTALTLNADIDRIGYSKLLNDFDPALSSRAGYSLSNATEIHVGGEWAFPQMSLPFAIRAGWWHDPAHSPVFNGSGTAPDEKLASFYFGPDLNHSHNHFAVGAGFLGTRYSLNAAYDHASNNSTASVSFLTRF